MQRFEQTSLKSSVSVDASAAQATLLPRVRDIFTVSASLAVFLTALCPTPARAINCATTQVVKQAGGGNCTTIQACVNLMPATLTGDYCIDIQDSATYTEAVTVQNVAPAGYTIVIGSTTGSNRPVVNPPAGYAFAIYNASVTIARIDIAPTSSISYGVAITSAHVTVSSVNVKDAGGRITGAGIALSSRTLVEYSSVTMSAANSAAYVLSGSTLSSIARSSAAMNNASGIGVYAVGASSNSFSHLFIGNASGAAFQFDAASNYNAVSASTITGDSGGFGALHLSGASTNTFTSCYFGGASGVAVNMQPNANFNVISMSTLSSVSSSWAAINLESASSNTVSDSRITNTGNNAVFVQAGANGNLIRRSTVTINADFAALYVWNSSSNTLESSYVQNLSGNGIFFDLDAKNNRVVGSSAVIAGATPRGALVLYGASTNTVTGGSFYNSTGHAMVLRVGAVGNTISASTATSAAAGSAGIFVTASASNTISGSYAQGNRGVWIDGSTGTVVDSSRLVGTGASGLALEFEVGSVNLTLASSTLSGGSTGRGLYLDLNNRGAVAVGSVTVTGAREGVAIQAQASGFSLAIDSITFRSLAAGATAVHFLGGTHVSTITLASFEDTTTRANVSGAALAGGRVTMRAYRGPRAGPAYENDPSSRVDWTDHGPYAGCVETRNVGAGQNYGSITAALAALPATLTGHSCVVIRDAATYAEEVTVQGFVNNASSISIFTDPFVGARAVVAPPGGAGAAFNLFNASVNVKGFDIRPTGALNYGILASSVHARVENVLVEGGAFIALAGIRLSSRAAVVGSSVAVTDAHGIWLETAHESTVSASSVTVSASGSEYALYFNDTSSAAISDGIFTNTAGGAAFFESGAHGNAVARSTFTGAGSVSAVMFNGFGSVGASSNTLDRVYAHQPSQPAVFFNTNARWTQVSGSTLTTSSGWTAVQFGAQSASNTITGSVLRGGTGGALTFSAGSVWNELRLSTAAVTGSGDAVTMGGSSNTIDRAYLRSDAGAALAVTGGANQIQRSTGSSGGGWTVLALFAGASTNTVSDSLFLNVANPAGAAISGATSNLILRSSFVSAGWAAFNLAGSSNTLTDSYVRSSAGTGLHVERSSYNVLTALRVDSPAGVAVHFVAGRGHSLARSTLTAGGFATLHVNGSSANVVADSWMDASAGYGAVVDAGSHDLLVQRSTFTSSVDYALNTGRVSSVTVLGSYLGGAGGFYAGGSSETVVGGSRLLATAAANPALFLEGGSSGLRLSSSVLTGGLSSYGVGLNAGTGGALVISTNTIAGARFAVSANGLLSGASLWISSNTILPVLSSAFDTYGVNLQSLASGATIHDNSIYYRTAGSMGGFTAFGLIVQDSQGVVFRNNRINNPGLVTAGSFAGVYVSNADSASIYNNDMHSSGTALTNAHLVRVLNGTSGASFYNNAVASSFSVTGASATIEVDATSQSGFYSDYNLAFSSNALKSALWGAASLSLLDGSWMAVTGNDRNSVGFPNPMWHSLGAGSEDFHPRSRSGRWDPGAGGFVNDAMDSEALDAGRPQDSVALETSPNGGRVNAGSYGGTAEASRSQSYACSTVRRVQKVVGPYTDIGTALSAVWPELSGPTCIIVQDAGIYVEQVTVEGFTNNGSSISIFTDPAVGAYATLSPPAASTAAFQIANASVNVAGMRIVVDQRIPYGIDASSSYITISSVSVSTSGGSGIYTAGVRVSSWSAISYSSVTVWNTHGYWLDGSTCTTISYSSATNNSASSHALFLQGASSNTFTVLFASNSHGSGQALVANFSDSNTVTQSYLWGGARGISLNSDADFNTVSQSTMIGNIYGLFTVDADSNTVSQSYLLGGNRGLFINTASSFTTISLSTVVSNHATLPGALIAGSSGTVILDSYIQGSTSVIVSGSTGTYIGGSVLVATNVAGDALALLAASVGLTVATSTLISPSSGRGLVLSTGNAGAVNVGSVTISGAALGVEISTQAGGFTLAVDSVNFRGLASGATAIHFLGGTFVATITAAAFEDAGVGANVSGAALDLASRITMRGHYGARTGPVYENDPNSLVYWADAGPYPGCAVTNNVGAGMSYATIQSAVSALPSTLTGHSCVVVRDGGIYAEQVTVQNFVNNGSSITILADPGSGLRPAMAPPATATAAFRIANASVNVQGIAVFPTQSVAYGVYASSAYVSISSMVVSTGTGGGRIWSAAFRLASFNTVAYSSVTIGAATGFHLISGSSWSTIAWSTAVVSAPSHAALFMDGASSNTVLRSFLHNTAYDSAFLEAGANYNTITLSTMSSAHAGDATGLWLRGSHWNTVDQCYMADAGGYGAYLDSSNWNTISRSTALGGGSNRYALTLQSSASNTITTSRFVNSVSVAIWIEDSNYNTVSYSTAIGSDNDNAGTRLRNSDWNTLSHSYFSCAGCGNGDGAELDGGSAHNTISHSTFVTAGSSPWAGLWLGEGSSSNTISGSLMLNPSHVGLQLWESHYNQIQDSTMTAGSSTGHALELRASSWTAITRVMAQGGAGNGVYLHTGSIYNTIALSTMSSTGANRVGLYVDASSGNMITQSYVHSAAGSGGYLANTSHFSTVRQSTFVAGTAGFFGLLLDDVNDSRVEDSKVVNTAGHGLQIYGYRDVVARTTAAAEGTGLLLVAASSAAVYDSYVQGSTGAVVSASTGSAFGGTVFVATNTSASALYLTTTSVNLSVSSSIFVTGLEGQALHVGENNRGRIVLSTNTILAGSHTGIMISTQLAGTEVWVTSNTVLLRPHSANNVTGIRIDGLTTGATIQDNLVAWRRGGGMGSFQGVSLLAKSASGLRVERNRLGNPGMITGGAHEAVRLRGVTATLFAYNDVHSTGTALTEAYLLRLIGSTATVRNNVFSSSFAVSGASASLHLSADSGIDGDYNDWFSSNSLNTMVWGAAAAQFAGGWFGKDANSIASHPRWREPGAGAEDFHPRSSAGRFDPATQGFVLDSVDSPTIDRAAPGDPYSNEPAPNGLRANQGSYGDTAEASKTGGACGATYTVGSGQDYPTIQLAVDAIPSSLTQSVCVDINDSAIYAEMVTVSGKTTNGHRITIRGTQATAPRVNPPSTGGTDAAFDLNNASVTLHHVLVRPSASVEYGVRARQPWIYVSSANVDAGGNITTAGVALESEWATLTRSSVTVGAADGVYVSGSRNAVSYSSAISNNASYRALYAIGGSSNSFSVIFASNPAGEAFRAYLSHNLTVDQSTAASSSSSYALNVNASTGARLTAVYAANTDGGAITFNTGADYGYVSNAHAVSSGSSTTFDLFQVSSMTVANATTTNRGSSTANAMRMTSVGYSTITFSTFTTNGNQALYVTASTRNYLAGLYAQSWGSAGTAVQISNNSNLNTIAATSISVRETGAVALSLDGSSSCTATSMFVEIASGTALSLFQATGMTVENSTFTTAGDASYGILFNQAHDSRLTRVYGRSPRGDAAYLLNSHRNRVEHSTFTTDSAYRAIYANASSSNVYEVVLASNPAGMAVYWYASAHSTITLSTAVSNYAGTAFFAESSSGALVDRTYVRNATGHALLFAAESHRSTISYVTAFTSGTAGQALNVNGTSSVTLRDSFLMNAVGYGATLGGGWHSIMRSTIVGSGENGWAALSLSASSWTAITDSYANGQTGMALNMVGANHNTVTRSTFAAAYGVAAVYVQSGSSNVFTSILSTNSAGNGVYFYLADYNRIETSTVSSAGLGYYFYTSSANVVDASYLEARGGHALQFYDHADANVVSNSTIVARGANGFNFTGSSTNTIRDNRVYVWDVHGVNFNGGSASNVVIRSSIVVAGTGYAAVVSASTGTRLLDSYFESNPGLLIQGATNVHVGGSRIYGSGTGAYVQSSNGVTITTSVIQGGTLAGGLALDVVEANMGRIEISSNVFLPTRYAVRVATQSAGAEVWISSNLFVRAPSNLGNNYAAIDIDGLATGATIEHNSFYLRESGVSGLTTYAVRAKSAAGLVLRRNRVNNPGMITSGSFAAFGLTDADRVQFLYNDVHSTGTSFTDHHLLRLESGSTGARLRGNVFSSSAAVSGSSATILVSADSQSGFNADYNDYHSSNAALGFVWGASGAEGLSAWRSTSGDEASSLSVHPQWAGLAAGGEDFHPKSETGRYVAASGSFVLDSVTAGTIDAAPPGDAYAEENSPNGARANQGSHGGTGEASKTANYPGCVVARNVGAGMPYATIQAGVNALPATLTGHSCVVIRDAATYAEQVTVQNFVNNGSSISIFTDPAVGSYATLDPPASSTAAFFIKNASVNVYAVGVKPTVETLSYAVYASSDRVRVSSMNADSGGRITVAGLWLRGSYGTVSYSSVTVGGAHALALAEGGAFNAVSYSSFVAASAAHNAAYLNDSDSNTLTGIFARNSAGTAMALGGGADHNQFVNGFSSAGTGGSYTAFFAAFVTSNVIAGSRLEGGYGAFLDNSAYNTTITGSTLTAAASGASALRVQDAPQVAVSGSFLTATDGHALELVGGAHYASVTGSTMTGAGGTFGGLYGQSADSASISGCYVSGTAGAVFLSQGSNGYMIAQSTIVNASIAMAALEVDASSDNVVTGSFIRNAAGDAVYLLSGSARNVISVSTMIAAAGGYGALNFADADTNTVTGSYMQNLPGDAVYLEPDSDYNTISQSTIVSNASAYTALTLDNADWNSVTGNMISNRAGDALMFFRADRNVVSMSTVTSDSATRYAVYVNAASSNTLATSYIQGSTAVLVNASTGSIVDSSVLVATNTTGVALNAQGGNIGLRLTSSTIVGAALGRGVQLHPANNGTILIGSVTVTGAGRGIEISTQAANFTLSVDSVNFRGLASGATAIHFLGGAFVATITGAGFEDSGVGANVSAAALDGASRITMRGSKGLRHGPGYENDPASLVDWPDLPAPGAPALWFVAASSGGLTYGTVGADGYTVQASTAADFSGVLHSSTSFNGDDRLAPVTLDPNTTYYFRAGSLWGGATIYAQTTVSTSTLASLVSATTAYQVHVTSVVINWAALPLAPPDASSKTSEGYLLEAADDIAFTNIVASSRTLNSALSTLTVSGLYGDTTYYFRVGTLNWSGAVHYAVHAATYMPLVLGVELTTTSVVVPGGTPMNTEVAVTTATVALNTGNVNETYFLRVTTTTGGSPWFAGATPHADRYAAWTVVNSTQAAAADYEAADLLGDSELSCAARFTMGNETCVAVPPGATRTFWMKIWTPLVTTTGNSQDIRLIVRPEKAP